MGFNNITSEYYYDEFEDDLTEAGMDEPESVRHIAIGMLGFLSVAGIIGNSLVLYVFTRQKQKLSSTVFILTLAGTDLITSLVTMPYTIALEFLKYNVPFDAVCKVYQFITTTTIPLSSSVMVAIAVDRYLCIVHPFKHTMTIKRARFTVLVLVLFSVCLGLPSSLMYGIYKRETIDRYLINDVLKYSDMTLHGNNFFNSTSEFNDMGTAYDYAIGSYLNETDPIIYVDRNTGRCHKNGLILGMAFFNVYQKVYSSYFAICAVIVIVLYIIIYRSVLTRRRQRLHLTMANSCCGFLANQGQQNVVENNENNEHEQTECTMLNNARDKSPSSGSGSKKSKEEAFKGEFLELEDKNGNANCTSDSNNAVVDSCKDALMRPPNGVSRAKLEKLRMANIKTAFCLSIVALTYIVAFLPAWLMALSIIPMNAIVFFMYFTYNVANPVIYAFLNQSFRNHLQTLFKC